MSIELNALSSTLSIDEFNKLLNANKKIIDQQLDVCFDVFKTYGETFRVRDLNSDLDVCKELNVELRKVAQVVCKIREIARNSGNTNLVEKANQHFTYLKIVEQIGIKQFELFNETSWQRKVPLCHVVASVLLYMTGIMPLANSLTGSVAAGLAISAGILGVDSMHFTREHEKLMNLYKSKTDANLFWQ